MPEYSLLDGPDESLVHHWFIVDNMLFLLTPFVFIPSYHSDNDHVR